MRVNLCEIGLESSKVIVIDEFLQTPSEVIEMAADLSPFPRVENHYYPRLRRLIYPGETAFAHVDHVCGNIASLIKHVFGYSSFKITEAGFSLITQRPKIAS